MTHAPASWLALSAAVAIAAGLVGAVAVMRRITLAADALSHVALPGIGIALLIGIHPLLGATAALLVGAWFIWALERRTRLETDAVVGVVFSAALAAGALLTTREDLIDALFGAATTLGPWELAAGFGGAAAVIAFIIARRDRLVLMFLSPDVARTVGIDVRRLNLEFMIALALTVALGLRYLGALLMGSLIIIPAATARQLARDLRGMLVLSVTVALVATVAGTDVAWRLHRESGPVIVSVAAACFLLAMLVPRARRRAPRRQ